ncbi:MAG: thermonuclease family protein [Planctomycetota bacterium]|nr:thermonuclease family protein [Planctomycetota bacterium]
MHEHFTIIFRFFLGVVPDQPRLRRFSGVVVGVIDGDTVEVKDSQQPVNVKPIRVRLDQIDAPERRRPFGTWSPRMLASAVFQKTVSVREGGKDRYKRIVGTLCLGDKTLLDIESEARAARRGLWRDPNPVSPWEWRKAP